MKSCREVRSRILPAVDGSLPIEKVFELEEHVRGCDGCRAQYEEARAVDAALARFPEPPIDRIDLDRAVAGVRAAIDAEVAPATRRIRVGRLAAAAAILFAVLLLVRAMRPHRAPSTTPPEIAAIDEPALGSIPAPEPVRTDITPPSAPAIAPAITPIASAIPEEPLDPSRLERARAEVRCLLARAAEVLPPLDDPSPALDLATRFDDGARDLARRGWPVLRLVEENLGDPDPLVARAAARYLGARGDRISLRALETFLARPEPSVDLALALCDAGDAGEAGLAAALREPRSRPLVLARLSQRGGESSARLLEGAVRDAAASRSSRGGSVRLLEALDALARIGPASVPRFLHLGSDATLSRAETIDALARTEGAADAVGELVLSRPRSISDSLTLEAIGALQPIRALALLERRCIEQRDLRPQALACISLYGGRRGLEVLVRLAASGRIPREEIESPILATLASDREAGRALVEEGTHAGRRVELAVFQQILSEAPGPECTPALVALGGCDLLTSSDRRWSVLLAGETGVPEDAEALAELFGRVRTSEKEIRAACLIAIRSLAGPERLERLVNAFPPRVADRVLALLAAREAKDRPTTTVSRLARELESALASLSP